MFEMLQLNFFQNDTNKKAQVRTSLNIYRQGPEQEITECIGTMITMLSSKKWKQKWTLRTKDNFMLTIECEIQGAGKKVYNSTTGHTYQEFCANLLLADNNHKELNLYEMNMMELQMRTAQE